MESLSLHRLHLEIFVQDREQRVSSAYHPGSNKLAELAVKQAKRLIQDSLGPAGSPDIDSMARALLAHRNTQASARLRLFLGVL